MGSIGFSPLPNSLPFLMLGDFGGARGTLHDGGDLQWKHQVAERMGIWAEVLHPRFVVGLGDNFYDVGVETAEDPAWDDQFESFYTAPALRSVPWLMCLGNHDYMGSPEAQINRTNRDPHGRWYMPSRAYSRLFVEESASVEIFSVDTNAISFTLTPETAGSCAFAQPVPGCSPRFEEEGARVEAELENLLQASTATWKIVVGHHPLFSAGHHGAARETAPLRAALLPLLDRYGVDLYACGHDHIAQHVTPTTRRTDRSPPMSLSVAPTGWRPSQEGDDEDKDEEEEGGGEKEAEMEEQGREASAGVAESSSPPGGRELRSATGSDGWSIKPLRGHFTRGLRRQDAEKGGARAAADLLETDHLSIGTSGPMVMPGMYDFDFEDGGSSEPGVVVQGGEKSDEDCQKIGGSAGDGCHDRRGPEFDLLFATKRRAFGVVEATGTSLRVSLVGRDGDVLYSFDRAR